MNGFIFALLLHNIAEKSSQENSKEIKNTLPDELGNPESLKKQSQQFQSFSTNVSIAGEDLLRAFYRFFFLRFCDSSDQ